MNNISGDKELELLLVIVKDGLGSKILKSAKHYGVPGGTIFLGKGTTKNRFLEFLDLCDIRKEIVLMIAEKTIAYHALEELNKEFHYDKPNHGIAFSSSVTNLIGVRNYKENNIKESRGVENTMYKAIIVIVDKGKAQTVIEAATKAGSRGGTIINGRGSGIHETNMLFSMAVEPEKEIVLILSEDKQTDTIVSFIREQLKIDEPGNGIIFIQDVNKTYGLY